MNSVPQVPAPMALMEMIGNGSFAQAIYVAAKLGVADVLADGPLDAAQIAARADTDTDATFRLLRLLSSRGVFRMEPDGRFALNELSDPLRSDAEVSIRPWSLFIGSPEHREHWSHLDEAVRTGKAVVPALRGMSFFEFTRSNPEFGKVFDDSQTSVSGLTLRAVLSSHDFSPYSVIVDIGGGNGRLLGEILSRTPGSRGVLYDTAPVVEGARERLSAFGDRCTITAGSFFDAVPPGGDAYILKHVLHNWSDDEARTILGNIKQAMSPEGRLLVIEILLPEGNAPNLGFLTDLNLLALFGGKERTEREHRELLAAAGFEVERVVPTPAAVSIMMARLA
ncbi:methyltransferase [Nocardia wallacei]|uniref:methyltransferase n=1 Tax=Nocardia wallacei TaxID=480035 RepID=UPI0024575AF8|nr:methyltransferase [Nocardia wallacei]